MTDLQKLAEDVLAMFELQREFFKTRNPEKLNQCKQVEAALKRRCAEILHPKPVKPDLFT